MHLCGFWRRNVLGRLARGSVARHALADLSAVDLTTVGILDEHTDHVSPPLTFDHLATGLRNRRVERWPGSLRSSRAARLDLPLQRLRLRLGIVQALVGRCGQVWLHGSLLFEHFAGLARDLGRVSDPAVHLVGHFLQVFHSFELVVDLVVHELGELSTHIMLLSSLLLNHLGLEKNAVLLLPLSLFLVLLVAQFLLLSRVRVDHEAFDAVRDRVLDTLLLLLPL